MAKLLFLTGVGRSGTTLLQQMLHAHSEIAFKPETHFFKSYILPFLLAKSHSDEVYKRAAGQDKYLERLTDEERLALINSNYNFNAISSSFQNLLMNSATSIGADKDTEYVRYFPHLKKVYPECYVINMIRDPRDVVLSRIKTPWGSKRSVTFHAAEYTYYLKKNRKEGPELFGDHYIEVKYEDLITDPQKELIHILNRMGLTFESNILDYSKKGSTLIAEDEKAWKDNAGKPILKGNANKWKDELDKSVVGILENNLSLEMEELGYEKSGARPALLKSLEFYGVYSAFQLKSRKERIRG
jgi:hypothetical protein